jgi:hypothetical protein
MALHYFCVCVAMTGVLHTKRRREGGRTPGDAVHGSRENHQAVVTMQLHRIRAPPALRGFGRTPHRTTGEPTSVIQS